MAQLALLNMLKEFINLIPKLIYFICVSCMSLLDAIQLCFRKLAGLDVYYINGTAQTGDIGYKLIKNAFSKNSEFPVIQNAFWALVIFGVVLLILSTIVAIIRQEYMADGSNDKMSIVKKSFKSLFMFFIVPLSCIFGLLIGDILLGALDKITAGQNNGQLFSTTQITNKLKSQETYAGSGVLTYSNYDIFGLTEMPSSNTPFSGMMFKTAAYNCNRIRKNDKMKYNFNSKAYYEYIRQDELSNFGIFNQGNSKEECAQILDEAFANCVILKTSDKLNIDDGPMKSMNSLNIFKIPKNVSSFSKFNVSLVWYYYDLWEFNFLVAFAFLVVALKIFVNIVFGLMKRIVEIVALFIISPPIIAVMPLDGGNAFGQWRKSFISKALTAFGAVIGMNLLFLILPYFNEIEFFYASSGVVDILNLIISTLLVLVGLSMVEGFISLISGFVGGEDASKTGAEVAEATGNTLAASGKYYGSAVGLATAPGRYVANKATKSIAQHVATKRTDFKKSDGRARKEWNRQGAEKAYKNYLNNNDQYKDEMMSRYTGRKDKSLDYDQWLKTPEGIKSQNSIVNSLSANNKIESFNDFKAGSSTEGGKALNAALKEASRSAIESSKLEAATAIKKIFATALKPVKNVSAFGSHYLGQTKSAFIRGGKGGMKSMILAFSGKTSKEIEQQEIYKRIQKEELARQQIQADVEKKMNSQDKNKK